MDSAILYGIGKDGQSFKEYKKDMEDFSFNNIMKGE